MTEDQESLIARVRDRDRDSLAQFVEMNRHALLAFIDRQVGTALRRKLEIEDIFQEVSADAVRSLGEIDLQDREPFNWLCQLAERRIIDAHRRYFGAQKRDAAREVPLGAGGRSGSESQQAGLINMLVISMTTPSQAFSRNAKELRLQAAMKELPEEQREVLKLRYVEGLPSKEIAEKIGKSDAAVRVMLTRSLKKLQTLLGVEDPKEKAED